MQNLPNSYVQALTTHNGRLVAGGQFYASGLSYVAGWDGSVWQPMGSGMGNHVYALDTWKGQIIAGGRFDTAGSKVAAYWARYGSGITGDLNCDGIVNLIDLGIQSQNWLVSE